ncbi:MAG: hypothetical protein A2341_08145 [Deltaproteobacteria bacterium RIFOXYB12_FULL_58_9]|nr:MAG: hypothetical protein A2341_08145 [Deltaproteobacteria bacterium RIFOXYB12_FULL_58_9]
MRRLMLITTVALAASIIGKAALAYVLPTEFILRMLADKRINMKIVDLTVYVNTEVGDRNTEDRIYLKKPERLRHLRQGEETTMVEVQREGKAAEGPEDALKRIKGQPFNILPTLLFPKGEEIDEAETRMMEALKGLGVDTKTTALGRFDDRVHYIIGARSYESDLPQLWIDKETFLPARLIVKRAGKEKRELRWLEFGSSTTGDWFPRVTEIWVDGKRIERSEVEKVELNKKIPETLFDIP